MQNHCQLEEWNQSMHRLTLLMDTTTTNHSNTNHSNTNHHTLPFLIKDLYITECWRVELWPRLWTLSTGGTLSTLIDQSSTYKSSTIDQSSTIDKASTMDTTTTSVLTEETHVLLYMLLHHESTLLNHVLLLTMHQEERMLGKVGKVGVGKMENMGVGEEEAWLDLLAYIHRQIIWLIGLMQDDGEETESDGNKKGQKKERWTLPAIFTELNSSSNSSNSSNTNSTSNNNNNASIHHLLGEPVHRQLKRQEHAIRYQKSITCLCLLR